MTRTINRLNKTIRDLHREMRAKDTSADPLYADGHDKKESHGDHQTP
jgi:hypothetical protein